MNRTLLVTAVFAAFTGFIIFNLSADVDNRGGSDLIFSHELHVIEHEAECTTCHPAATTSVSGKDDLLPKGKLCFQCHDEVDCTGGDKADAKCSFCHTKTEKTGFMPRISDYSEKFNHKLHIEKGAKCETCHAGVERKKTIAGLHLPDMDKCMTCHSVPQTVAGCVKCHTESDELRPADHTNLWLANHGRFSESKSGNCMSCHTESYCMDCHKGENLANQSHPPQFIMTHSISYMMRESNCMSCHNDMQYCIECHTQVNYIKPISHTAFNWIAIHQKEAKPSRDLCVVCHSVDDRTCARCH